MRAEPIHVRPTAHLAERVLLPGDPGRALLLAQALLAEPKMFNHHRGLWGYTGAAADGEPLTIQSTGMGGPSAAIVITELAGLGARCFIRVGTCGALAPHLDLGDLVLARGAIPRDGTSRALGAGATTGPDDGLTSAIAGASDPRTLRQGLIVTTDLFYDDRHAEHEWTEAGALAVEMETATLFTIAANRGLRAAALLLVTDLLGPPRQRIDPDALATGERRLGEAATRGLLSDAARSGEP